MPMMPGRVFSTMYFSFSITCFGVPATIMVLASWFPTDVHERVLVERLAPKE